MYSTPSVLMDSPAKRSIRSHIEFAEERSKNAFTQPPGELITVEAH